jgi:hypothetical protein
LRCELYGGDWDFASKGWNEKSLFEFDFGESRGRGVRGETKNNDLAQGGGSEGNEIERTSEREARTPLRLTGAEAPMRHFPRKRGQKG